MLANNIFKYLKNYIIHLVFILLLMGLIFSLDFNLTINNPSAVSQWANQLINYQIINDRLFNNFPNRISIDLAQHSFNFNLSKQTVIKYFDLSLPKLAKKRMIINFTQANFKWLNGQIKQPALYVNIGQLENNLAVLISNKIIGEINALPVCNQQFFIKDFSSHTTINPSVIICQPLAFKNLPIKSMVLAVVRKYFGTNDQYIQFDLLIHNEPYYKVLSWMPMLYQVIEILPVISAIMLVFLIIILKKLMGYRQFIKTIYWSLIVSTLIMLSGTVVAYYQYYHLLGWMLGDVVGFNNQIFYEIIHQILMAILKINALLLFTIISTIPLWYLSTWYLNKWYLSKKRNSY